MRNVLIIMAGLLLITGCSTQDSIRLTWKYDYLTVISDRIPPNGEFPVRHLEAFCRSGSTDRDWSKTVIPFETEQIDADPNGQWIKLRTVIDEKVEVLHDIRAGEDEVDFKLTFINHSDEAVDVDWAQPCIRVKKFTGRKQEDYFKKCFIFTESGVTMLDETHRETKARYVPGQVYVPAGVNRNDVNPRPLSQTVPVNGLIGCFSADDSMILAAAWDHVQELFQGVGVCIHSDPRIGGLAPGETKIRRGKIYLLPNDIDGLLERYERDFPEQ